jgi:hypothetical protein
VTALILAGLVGVLGLAVAVLAVLLVHTRRNAAAHQLMAGVFHAAVHRLTVDLSEANAQLDVYRIADDQALRSLLEKEGGQS